VSDFRKVLIVELKRGGYDLTQKELDQGRDYGLYLIKTGAVAPDTPICVYVLGASKETGLGKSAQASVITTPMTYDVVLTKAHARTFRLLKKIEEARGEEPGFAQPQILGGEQPVLEKMFE
jgi:hypothetical protein